MSLIRNIIQAVGTTQHTTPQQETTTPNTHKQHPGACPRNVAVAGACCPDPSWVSPPSLFAHVHAFAN
eukprot:7831154-Prorocentrum_lima.AAC.1